MSNVKKVGTVFIFFSYIYNGGIFSVTQDTIRCMYCTNHTHTHTLHFSPGSLRLSVSLLPELKCQLTQKSKVIRCCQEMWQASDGQRMPEDKKQEAGRGSESRTHSISTVYLISLRHNKHNCCCWGHMQASSITCLDKCLLLLFNSSVIFSGKKKWVYWVICLLL